MSRFLRSCLLVLALFVANTYSAFAQRVADVPLQITLDELASPVACIGGNYTICWTVTTTNCNSDKQPITGFTVQLGRASGVSPYYSFDPPLAIATFPPGARCGTITIPNGLDSNLFYAIRVLAEPCGVSSNVKFINVRPIDVSGRPQATVALQPVKKVYCKKDTVVIGLTNLVIKNNIPPPTYQWLLNDSVLKGQTGPILRYTDLGEKNCFKLLVTKGNQCAQNDTGTSNTICVTVKKRPKFVIGQIGSGCADSVTRYKLVTDTLGINDTIRWYLNKQEIKAAFNSLLFVLQPGQAQCKDKLQAVLFTNTCPDTINSNELTIQDCGKVRVTSVVPTSFCAGDTARVSYTTSACFGSSNVFTFYLSDKNGSFANATAIGSKADTIGGTATVLIPATADSGTKYLIRISSSSPSDTSINRSGFLTIYARPAAVTASPAVRCGPGNIKLKVSSAGATKYAWYTAAVGGDLVTYAGGGIVTTDTLTVFVTRDTTFYVEGINPNGCRSATRTAVSVTVGQPIFVSAGPDQEACQNGPAVAILGGSPTGGTFTGLPPAAGAVSGGNFNPGTLPAGLYTVKYVYVSPIGCKDSATKTITIKAFPTVSAGTADSSVCTPGPPVSFQLGGFSPAGGLWTSANSALVTGTGIVSVGALNPSGPDTLTYTIIQNGCTGSAFRVLHATKGPDFSVSIAAPAVCGTPGSVTLSPFDNTWTLVWAKTGDPAWTGATGTGPTFGNFPGGSYTVSVSGVNACPATTTFVVQDLAAPPVTISGLAAQLCSNGGKDTLTASIPGGSWSSQPVGAIDAITGIINPTLAASGTVKIFYTVTNTTTNCTSADSASVVVVAAPGVSAEQDTSVCKNAGLIALSTGGNWTGSSALSGSGQQFFDPAKGTLVNVLTKTVTFSGCSASINRTIFIKTPSVPQITPTGNATLCQGQTTTLTVTLLSGPSLPATGYLVTLRKLGSAAPVASNATGIFNIQNSGTYLVTVLDSSSCLDSSTATYTVVVDSIGTIDAGADQSVCRNALPFALVGSPTAGGGVATSWNGLGVVPQQGGTYSFDPAAVPTGTNSVNLYYLAQKGVCKDSSRRIITILPAPTAQLAPQSGGLATCQTSVPLAATPVGPGITYVFLRNGQPQSASPVTDPIYLADTSGTYQVLVYGATPGSCADSSASVNVNISKPPVLPSTLTSITACEGSQPFELEIPPAGGNTGFVWTGAGVTRTTPYFFYPDSAGKGNFQLKLVVSNGLCKDSITKGASVSPKPVATVGLKNSSSCVANDGKAWVIGVDLSRDSVQWFQGFTVLGSSDTLRNLGQGGYSVAITDKRTGCTSDVKNVTITAPGTFKANITGLANNAALCRIDTLIALTATPRNSTSAFKSDVNNAGDNNGIYQIKDFAPGRHFVSYSVQDATGCLGFDTLFFMVKALPNARATQSDTLVCTGQRALLTAISAGASTYTWYLNYPKLASAPNTNSTYIATQPGNYVARVDSNGCSSITNALSLNVIPAPPADITVVGNPNGCIGSPVTLVASGAQTGNTIKWLVGGVPVVPQPGTPSTLVTTQNGSYQVVIANAACADTSTAKVVAFTTKPGTAIQVTNPSPCFGDSALLQGSPTTAGVRYTWYFQPNLSSPLVGDSIKATANIYATKTGRYTLRVINTALGCDSSTGQVVQIGTKIDTSITVSGATRFCKGGNVTLRANDNDPSNQYSWKFNGPPFSANSSITVNTAGTYQLVIRRGACADSSRSVAVVVDSVPSARIVPDTDQVVCQDQTITLRALPKGLVYGWSSQADSPIDTLAVPTGTPGRFTYSVTVKTPFCSATSQPVNITVKASPSATLTAIGITTICPGQSVTLIGNSFNGAIATFYRNVSEIVPGPQSPPVRQITQKGSYTFELNLNGCKDTSAAINIIVPSLPKPLAGPDKQFCVNAPTYTIVGYSPALNPPKVRFLESYITGDVFNPASAGIGTKTITLAYTDSGCTVSDTAFYTVVPAFSVSALPLNASICVGTSTTLTATLNPRTPGAVYTYQWRDSAGVNIPGATDSSYTTTKRGNYTVVVTLNECQAESAPATIEYIPFNSVNAGPDKSVCVTDAPFSLFGTPGNGKWKGIGVDSNGRYTPSPPSLGANTLVYTTNQGGCTLTDTVVVTVNNIPTVGITYVNPRGKETTDPINILESAELTGTGADSYVWSPNVALSATTGTQVFATPRTDQTYTVTGTTNGCSNTASITVRVNSDVRVANGFSPNGDEVNDFWNIYNIQAYPQADIRLYNRWGALVYKAKGADIQEYKDYWDGRAEGKDAALGVYYYIIDLNNNQKPFTGSVTLVR